MTQTPAPPAQPNANRPPQGLHPLEAPNERRADARYPPQEVVTVQFAHPDGSHACIGQLDDISYRGARVSAPPHARPHLHLGDPVRLSVRASDSPTHPDLRGLQLSGHVVRMVNERDALTVQLAFGALDGTTQAQITRYLLHLAHQERI